jgi:hypothetical protein
MCSYLSAWRNFSTLYVNPPTHPTARKDLLALYGLFETEDCTIDSSLLLCTKNQKGGNVLKHACAFRVSVKSIEFEDVLHPGNHSLDVGSNKANSHVYSRLALFKLVVKLDSMVVQPGAY